MCYRMYCILYMARVSLDYKLSTGRIRNEVMQRYVVSMFIVIMCYRMYCILYMARVSLDYKLSTSRIRNEVMQQYVWFMKDPWLMWLNFVLALVRLGYPQQNKHI